MIKKLVVAIAVLAGLSTGALAQQDYPNRIIKIIQGFPPGGNVDIIARILGHEMEKSLGQSIVVEAKTGLAGLEGIVCKRIDLPYRPGPARRRAGSR